MVPKHNKMDSIKKKKFGTRWTKWSRCLHLSMTASQMWMCPQRLILKSTWDEQ